MHTTSIRYDLRNHTHEEITLSLGNTVYIKPDLSSVSLLKHLRINVDWDIDRITMLSSALADLAVSRGKDKIALAELAYLASSAAWKEFSAELDAIGQYFKVLWNRGIEIDISTIHSIVSGSVLKSVVDDDLLIVCGAFAHSHTPIYVSYSSVIKEFLITYDASFQLVLYPRKK